MLCGTDQVLKDKEQLIILPDHLLQLDHTGVVQLAERLDFPQGHTFLPTEELALHFLDRYLRFTQSLCVLLMHLACDMILLLGPGCASKPARTHWIFGLHVGSLPHTAIRAIP